MAEINLALLIQQRFGYVAKPFDEIKTDNLQARKMSLLGTPIISPTALDGFDLPNEAIVEVTGGKTIVKTQIDGQDGTFKELFAMNDWQVTIMGMVVQEEEESEDYPEDTVRQLREILEKKTSVKIVNPFLSLFNIDQVVIESWSFPAAEGSPGLQPYQFVCVSDKTFDLEFKTAGTTK